MTTTKLDLDAILNEPNVLTQEELIIFDIDYILESTDTDTDFDFDFDFDFDLDFDFDFDFDLDFDFDFDQD
jgi:hypothetical protein